jgi:hypothetical protein
MTRRHGGASRRGKALLAGSGHEARLRAGVGAAWGAGEPERRGRGGDRGVHGGGCIHVWEWVGEVRGWGARRWSGRGGGGRGGGMRGGEGSETAVVAMAGRSGAGEVRRQSCASAGGVGPTE